MDTSETLAMLKYTEALQLPKFKASLDRLLNRRNYDSILSTHSIDQKDLLQFTEKAISEGNAVLIQREYCGYMVIIWRD